MKAFKIVGQFDGSLQSIDSNVQPAIHHGSFEPVEGESWIITALKQQYGDLKQWSGGELKYWLEDIEEPRHSCANHEFSFTNGDWQYAVYIRDVEDVGIQKLRERMQNADFCASIPEDRWDEYVVQSLIDHYLTPEERGRLSEDDDEFTDKAIPILVDAFIRHLTK